MVLDVVAIVALALVAAAGFIAFAWLARQALEMSGGVNRLIWFAAALACFAPAAAAVGGALLKLEPYALRGEPTTKVMSLVDLLYTGAEVGCFGWAAVAAVVALMLTVVYVVMARPGVPAASVMPIVSEDDPL